LKSETLIVKESRIRLDKYLAEKVNDISRSQLQKHIKNGGVLVNGEIKPTNYRLSENDEIQINILEEIVDESFIEPQSIPVKIIFEDDEIIVINKQAGLTVHPGVGNRDGTLANALAHHFKELSDINGPTRPGIVHRLDKDTSGIIVIAKNNFSHMKLAEQFSERMVKKMYYGITWGKWKTISGMINEPIARKRSNPKTYNVNIDGKVANTEYRVIGNSKYFSFVNYFPKTGRTHQIRVHSAFMGNPIIGDEKYGGVNSKIKGYIPEIIKKMNTLFTNVNRHILHAQKISFIHPRNKSKVSFKADLPSDIQKIIDSIKSLNV
jgi:23S rRNA pseudouridine1911/1915/1917 synthase